MTNSLRSIHSAFLAGYDPYELTSTSTHPVKDASDMSTIADIRKDLQNEADRALNKINVIDKLGNDELNVGTILVTENRGSDGKTFTTVYVKHDKDRWSHGGIDCTTYMSAVDGDTWANTLEMILDDDPIAVYFASELTKLV